MFYLENIEVRSDGVLVERYVADGILVLSNNIAMSCGTFPTQLNVGSITAIRNPARFFLLFTCGKTLEEDVLEVIQNNFH